MVGGGEGEDVFSYHSMTQWWIKPASCLIQHISSKYNKMIFYTLERSFVFDVYPVAALAI